MKDRAPRTLLAAGAIAVAMASVGLWWSLGALFSLTPASPHTSAAPESAASITAAKPAPPAEQIESVAAAPSAAPTPPAITTFSDDVLELPCPSAAPRTGDFCGPIRPGATQACGYGEDEHAVSCRCEVDDRGDSRWDCEQRGAPVAQCPPERPSPGSRCETATLNCTYESDSRLVSCDCSPGADTRWTCGPFHHQPRVL